MTAALVNAASGYRTFSRLVRVSWRPSTSMTALDPTAMLCEPSGMPSTIWTGSISFGLVAVPVRVISATKSLDVRFNQLEESTNARIQKGYEISPGQYVVVDDDEMQALAPKSSRMIEIEDFVDLDDIDPLYFEQPYYLTPDATALKPYKLLVEAMGELRKVAIGRVVMRSKERLVAIRPLDGVLCLE